MTFNYGTASTLYQGTNTGDVNLERKSLDEILASVDQGHSDIVEGRITYASPVTTFHYQNNSKGFVQNYFLTDVLAEQNQHQIYSYRVTAWNDAVIDGKLCIDKYYKLSNFAWKLSTYTGQVPSHRSKYEIHLKKNSGIEEIPV